MREENNQHPLALLITRNFPPLMGGMEKLNQHLLEALQPAWRAALCGPTGSATYVSLETEVRQSPLKPLVIFLVTTLLNALRTAWRNKPAVVIAGSGLTAPIAWLVGRCFGSKVAVYLHGLDIVAPSWIYQTFWLPFIRRCDIAFANSANTAQLAALHRVPFDKLHVLHPGVELPALGKDVFDFREHFGFHRRPLLLSVGRLTHRKGLAEFIANALPIVAAKHPDVLLVIIGDEASNALQAKRVGERERILAAARNAGMEQNIHFLGRCDDVTLRSAYRMADLHIFPVLRVPGDVEGFGMVALEAAANGLPTIAFSVGGVPDAVLDGCTGSLIESGDYQGFAFAVLKQIEQTRSDAVVASCRAFAASKAWPVFGERLRALLSNCYD